MNGFFCTDHTDQVQPYRKIKERNITLSFSTKNRTSPKGQFQVKGNGCNEFGHFTLEGTYIPDIQNQKYWLQCNKQYGGISKTYDSDDSIDEEDDHGADVGELNDLEHDAEISVEELRKKYYNATNAKKDDDNDDDKAYKPPATKRQKVANLPPEDDEEDDDDCGF